MRTSSKTKIKEIESWVDEAIAKGSPGERLPNVKTLMRRFRAGQKIIQAAIQPHIEAGQLISQRGLGLMITEGGEPAKAKPTWDGDLLVLRRTSESAVAANLIRGLERTLRKEGLSLLQIGYTEQGQALEALNSLGRFKVCLLQSHFQRQSIDFLYTLKRHARHIVVDGAHITGIDIDSIGTDWRGALLLAFHRLRELGHKDIAFLTSAHSARSIAMARREFYELSSFDDNSASCPVIQLDALPGEYRADDIVAALTPYRDASKGCKFSALIVWGVVDGAVLNQALTRLGWQTPEDLSLILLGSTDRVSEHLSKFDVIGNSDSDKLAHFLRVINDRMSDSQKPTDNHYLEFGYVPHGSVAPKP